MGTIVPIGEVAEEGIEEAVYRLPSVLGVCRPEHGADLAQPALLIGE